MTTRSVLVLTCVPTIGVDSYYKEPPIFSMAPKLDKSVESIGRFGPVGMAIELIQPTFTMRIKDIDQRIQLGNLITKPVGTVPGES